MGDVLDARDGVLDGSANCPVVEIDHTSTRVTDYNPDVLNETRIQQLEDAFPSTRWTAAARRSLGKLSLLGRLSYYAGWFDSRDDRSYPGEQLVDLEASYALSGSSTLAFGAQNALNRYPEGVRACLRMNVPPCTMETAKGVGKPSLGSKADHV